MVLALVVVSLPLQLIAGSISDGTRRPCWQTSGAEVSALLEVFWMVVLVLVVGVGRVDGRVGWGLWSAGLRKHGERVVI